MPPPPHAAPDAGPWGDARDLDACRAAVDSADGRGRGALVLMLFALAMAGVLVAGLWVVATMWLPSWLKGPGPVSVLGPPLIKKAAPAPKVAAPPITTSTPPVPAEVQ
jgi:hypothetical protein